VPFQVWTMEPPHTPHSRNPVSRYLESKAAGGRGEPRLKPNIFCLLLNASCAVTHASSVTMRRASTWVTTHSSAGRWLSFRRPQASRFFVRPQMTSPV
jgi:hypothetical protein